MDKKYTHQHQLHFYHLLKDPGSALTHLIAAVAAILCAYPLISKSVLSGRSAAIVSMSIFICSMILLYGASAIYHSLDISKKINLVLRRIDHSMIFVLIAGSYTPVCMLVLEPSKGTPLLIFMWTAAIAGILIKIVFINCPHWVSSVIYIAMGWTCVFVFRPLLSALPRAAFLWLLAGGIIYTAGGVIYGLKLAVFKRLPKNFGSHEIFHLFVMGGSLCHFIFMYVYLL